ncbi:hypothetical protein LguiB_013653 [Lonicera macranthoides]
MAFKGAMQDPHGALSSWNNTTHYCLWHGISCSRKHRHRVVALKLASQGLVGSLSPHIGNLSFLKTINLEDNSFIGEIPQSLGRLFRLQVLNFSNNSFNGELPKNLSNCVNLHYLNLADNDLTGNFPTWVSSLLNLQTLDLGKNKLFGSIPSSIGNLSSLSVLSLIRCGLHSEIPQEMAHLSRLTYLQRGENNFSGEIPSGIYNISCVEYFSVAINRFSGTIPPYIGYTLPSLKYLNFGDNSFTGSIPNSVTNATKLEFIFFNSNSFMGQMPENLGKLLGLEVVFFYRNRIQDNLSFISSLANCSRLKIAYVGQNLLTGSLPQLIGNLSAHSISIDDCQLHGNIPSSIGNLHNLMVLNFEHNRLTGPIPHSVGKLNKLQLLYLGSNRLSGEIPSFLGNLTLLHVLQLDQNNMSGSIPPSLGNCSNLVMLDISTNELSGSISQAILSISSATVFFNLSHNGLTGFLKPGVGNMGNLVQFDVSSNRLSGFLPSSLSKCLSLEWLHLERNLFEGEIPPSWSELRGLCTLDLSSNKLSGPIPSFLGDLHLENLNLSFNALHGEVPTKGVFRNASAISIEGNNDLCGDNIVSVKLPPCRSPNSKGDNKLSVLLKVVIPIVVIFGCLAFLLCCFIFFRCLRASRKTKATLPSFINPFFRVSYADLLKATNGFSEANLIGLGSYGSVYKGTLHDGETVVAVKVLNLQCKGASESFMSECIALKSIRHRNVLKICSACSSVDFQDNEFKALVYEFMPNGSLENWLYGDGKKVNSKNLILIQRLNIAIDIAFALEHLHYGCDSTFIHGDLKPSNVLLDDEMTAKIGDFGLVKVISSKHQHNSIAVKGTIGDVAPGYFGNSALIQPKNNDHRIFVSQLLQMYTLSLKTLSSKQKKEEEDENGAPLGDTIRESGGSGKGQIVGANAEGTAVEVEDQNIAGGIIAEEA